MSFAPLKFQPGMAKPGTVYQAKNRWYHGNLVRWFNRVMQAWGGWDVIRHSGGAINLAEPVRGMFAWRRDAGAPVLAIGTPTKLWIFGTSALTDETPSGFTTGGGSATTTSGAFGTGSFGKGPFGVGDEAEETIVEAQSWQFDNWREDLIAWAFSDKRILLYDSSAASCAALTNAPTNCSGVFVSNENFPMALGPSGNPRRISWPDREDITNWTPGAANFAGYLDLKSKGRLIAGHATSSENLVWTDTDLFAISYVGGEFVYAPVHRGQASLISRRAAVVFDDKAAWMGDGSFYVYDGEVRAIPSEVADYVFKDLNYTQASKIHGYTRAKFQEVVWHYPSAASVECDKYVVFNWMYGFMYVGDLERTAGVDIGVYPYSMSADSTGRVYRDEIQGGSRYSSDSEIVEEYALANWTHGHRLYNGNSTDERAAIFTLDEDARVTAVSFGIREIGSAPGTAVARFYQLNSAGTLPVGTHLAESATVSAASATSSGGWVTFTLATPLALTAGRWAASLRYVDGDASNHIEMLFDGTGAYSGGNMVTYNGSVWSAHTGTTDPVFRIHAQTLISPYAESGPFELGAGDQVFDINEYIPDQNTLGAIEFSVFTSYYPVEVETEHGPYEAANPTPLRLNARQVRLKIEQVQDGWRFGEPRFDIEPGGLR